MADGLRPAAEAATAPAAAAGVACADAAAKALPGSRCSCIQSLQLPRQRWYFPRSQIPHHNKACMDWGSQSSRQSLSEEGWRPTGAALVPLLMLPSVCVKLNANTLFLMLHCSGCSQYVGCSHASARLPHAHVLLGVPAGPEAGLSSSDRQGVLAKETPASLRTFCCKAVSIGEWVIVSGIS